MLKLVKVQMLLRTIGQIPHLFLRHSSSPLRIRPIHSSSIKVGFITSSLLVFHFPSSLISPFSLLLMQMAAAEDYTFGPYKIHHSEVFYSTNLSYAMVNLRPLLPGNNALFSKHFFFVYYSLMYSKNVNWVWLPNNQKSVFLLYCL